MYSKLVSQTNQKVSTNRLFISTSTFFCLACFDFISNLMCFMICALAATRSVHHRKNNFIVVYSEVVIANMGKASE